MEFINPDILGPFSQFQMDFKNPIEKQNDSHALEELKQIIDPYILRRTKAMVAPDLPKLIEHIHYSEMSDEQAKLFETEKSRARNHLLSLGEPASRIHILSSIMRLRQLSNHPRLLHVDFLGTSGKFDDIVAGISDVVRSGNKILVFSSFLNCLNILGEFLNDLEIKYLTLTGSDSESQRSEAVRTFQENAEFQVFLISLKAGGTGLNLTAADYVFIIDPWWNPHVERQAIARAHRIGRTSPVFVTRFISTNSIEEKILKLQTSKSVLAENLIDIDISDHLSDDEIMALLE
jgi:non-specific serine/threonine protein kinase